MRKLLIAFVTCNRESFDGPSVLVVDLTEHGKRIKGYAGKFGEIEQILPGLSHAVISDHAPVWLSSKVYEEWAAGYEDVLPDLNDVKEGWEIVEVENNVITALLDPELPFSRVNGSQISLYSGEFSFMCYHRRDSSIEYETPLIAWDDIAGLEV